MRGTGDHCFWDKHRFDLWRRGLGSNHRRLGSHYRRLGSNCLGSLGPNNLGLLRLSNWSR